MKVWGFFVQSLLTQTSFSSSNASCTCKFKKWQKQAWAGMTAHLGLGIGNGQAFSQLFGLGMKKSIPNFFDWEIEWKIKLPSFWIGIGNEKSFLNPTWGKNAKRASEKMGTGISTHAYPIGTPPLVKIPIFLKRRHSLDWEWEWKTLFPTLLGKDLTKDYLEKVGNGNSRSCREQRGNFSDFLKTVWILSKLNLLDIGP